MTAFGWLALVPLILRVVFPWLTSRWRRIQRTAVTARRTRLDLDRDDAAPPIGKYSGFTIREMADIVRRVAEDIGVRDHLASLVLVVGHGSVSLNNPHESAHDCGACGGGRGGPNARAFAQMANDARVRQLLAAEGLAIEATTWFVGAQRNTCNNEVTFFDEDLVPPHAERHSSGPWGRSRRRGVARHTNGAAGSTRSRAGSRRWRLWPTCSRRAEDLAQPRPEYGHATNAFCIIGRRTRTRGLFLDRRAFLVSYDPTRDHDGRVLGRILAAVVPVVAGISLEYYFSYVDPTGYGCGTKLPHNVTSLLGVMDGAQSDLRSGLPWQMVEIHEPTRLTIVVESSRDRLSRAVRSHRDIERLVDNRWVWLACLDPESGALWELRSTGFVAHTPEHALADRRWRIRRLVPGEARVPGSGGDRPAPVDPMDEPGRTPRHDAEHSPDGLGARRRRIARPPLRAARHGITRQPAISERWTGWLAGTSMATACAASLLALGVYGTTGTGTHLLSYGAGSANHDGGIAIEFLVDRLSLGFATLSTAIAGVVSAFSSRYLHREPGYGRYFMLLAMFVTGMMLVALAGNITVLFIGWELVGLSSALLVGFFHERPAAVANAFRVLSVYRISDAAMLSAAVLLRHIAGTDSLSLLFGRDPASAVR